MGALWPDLKSFYTFLAQFQTCFAAYNIVLAAGDSSLSIAHNFSVFIITSVVRELNSLLHKNDIQYSISSI